MLEDPYRFQEHLIMEINKVGNNLFIIDYNQHEFYTMTSEYKTILTGKLDNNNRDIIGFTQNDISYSLQYNVNNKQFYDMTCTDESIICCFKREVDNYKDYTYYVPFVITSHGIELSTDKKKIYKNEIIDTNDGVETHTIEYRFSKDLSRSFILQSEIL